MNKRNKMFYGWWIVIAITIVSFMGSINPFSIVLKQLMEQFQSGRGMISLALSISMAAGGVTGIFVGRILLNHSAKRLMLLGYLIGGISLIITGFTDSLWQLYICYFMNGVAFMGLSMISWFTLLSKWFSKNWGTAMGLIMFGTSIGAMIITPLVGIIAQNLGWQSTYLFAGLANLLISVPLILFILKDSPEQIGLGPDGNPLIERVKSFESQTKIGEKEMPGQKSGLSKYFKQPALWILGISFALIAVGDNAVIQHQVSFITDMNISVAIAASALGFTLGISGIAKLSAGWLSDRISSRYVCILFLLFEIAGILVLMNTQTVSDVWIFVVVYGLGAGAAGVLLPIVVKDVFGSAHFSAVFGFINVIYTVGAVLGIPLAGFIFDVTGSYAQVFVIVMITYLVAVLGIYSVFGVSPKPLLKLINKAGQKLP